MSAAVTDMPSTTAVGAEPVLGEGPLHRMSDPGDTAGNRRWVTLAVLCVSLLIIVIDNTIVNVTLPSLVRQLGASVSELQWVVPPDTSRRAARAPQRPRPRPTTNASSHMATSDSRNPAGTTAKTPSRHVSRWQPPPLRIVSCAC
jgi:hypothetical protein